MLQCNIDAKGKAIRLIWGILLVGVGLVLALIWARRSESWLAWVIVAVVLLTGAFTIFEGSAGWCVVRAMGFKTRF